MYSLNVFIKILCRLSKHST